MSKADHASKQGTVSFQIPPAGKALGQAIPWKDRAAALCTQCLKTVRGIPPRARLGILLAIAVIAIWRMAPERIYQAQTEPAGQPAADEFADTRGQESEVLDSDVEHAHYVSDSALLPYDVFPNQTGSLIQADHLDSDSSPAGATLTGEIEELP